MNRIKYIVNTAKAFGLVCLLAWTHTTWAQYVPWTIVPTASSQTVSFPANTHIAFEDGEPLVLNDAIGAFVLRNEHWVCVGYAFWEDQQGALLTAYGEYDGKPGYRNGEPLHFKVWRTSASCVSDIAETSFAAMPQTDSPDPSVFSPEAHVTVQSMQVAPRPAVIYPKYDFCHDETSALPVSEDGEHLPEDLQFTASEGLQIDPKTGRVNITDSTPGEYTITLVTTECLQNDTVTIRIHPDQSIRTSYERHLCPNETVRLEPEGDLVSYLWQDGSTLPYLDVDSPGVYKLEAVTRFGCAAEYAIRVKGGGLTLINSRLKTQDGNCSEGGQLYIENAYRIVGGTPPYVFMLQGKDPINQFYSPDSVFTDLPQDEYEVSVIEAGGCHTVFPQTVFVDRPENCDQAVITPDGDGIADYILIPFQGTARIYDRRGQVVRQLPAPARWDGRGSNGQTVPLGLYIVECEGEQMRVTVIR